MLTNSYITCDQCGQKIYHDDNMVHLIDGNEFSHHYCNLACANKSLNFIGKAENMAPSLFYDEFDPMEDRPYKKILKLIRTKLKHIIRTYSKYYVILEQNMMSACMIWLKR